MTKPLENRHPPGVSVILPVYNECKGLPATLHALETALAAWGDAWEIIIVDDGSTDGSTDAVAVNESVGHIIRHGTNRGYGAALKTGFSAARYELLAFLDADGSYPPERLPEMIEAVAPGLGRLTKGQPLSGESDSPTASAAGRTAPDGAAALGVDMAVAVREGYHEHSSLARRFGKALVLIPLTNYLAGCRIPDLNSGMRVVRRDVVERYWALLPDGFSLTTTLTMASLSAGRRVAWTPVTFAKRHGKSKIRPGRDMGGFLYLILRTMTCFNPLKIYLPLSVLFLTASLLTVFISYLLGQVMDVTSLFLFITGLQMLLIGVLADLILKLLNIRR